MYKECNQCLYDTKHPFGLSVYKEGCSGCDTHREKYEIDWNKKRDNLATIINETKRKTRGYDCVVPVVGDAEDYFVVSKVLELGLSPLIVSVNDYFKNDIGWHNIHQLITHFDVDSIMFNPDIRVYKDLVRTSLRKFEHILLPFLTLHTSFPIHIAKERGVPLVIWGQNQAVEQVGKFSHYDSVEMSEWSRKEHDLFRMDIDRLIGNGAQVSCRDLNYYKYPEISSLYNKGVRGIYLSNYFKWDPLKQNHSVLKHGFTPQYNSSSFDIYERAGSSVYYNFHDLLKYKRVGYRKIRDHLTREIRHGRVTRGHARTLEYQYNKSKVDVKKFLKWLGSTKSGADWFIMHHLSGYEHLIGEENEVKTTIPKAIKELLNDGKKPEKEYILIGKGVSI
jgi:N-acetyl sugar amidotransferase